MGRGKFRHEQAFLAAWNINTNANKHLCALITCQSGRQPKLITWWWHILRFGTEMQCLLDGMPCLLEHVLLLLWVVLGEHIGFVAVFVGVSGRED